MNTADGFALGQRLGALSIFGWLRAATKFGTYPASHETRGTLPTGDYASSPSTLHMPGYVEPGVPQRYRTLKDLLQFQSAMENVPEFQKSIVNIGGREYAPAGWVQTGSALGAQYGDAASGYRAYPALTLSPAGINMQQYGPLYDPQPYPGGWESLV